MVTPAMTSASYLDTHPNVLPILAIEKKVQDEAKKEQEKIDEHNQEVEQEENALAIANSEKVYAGTGAQIAEDASITANAQSENLSDFMPAVSIFV